MSNNILNGIRKTVLEMMYYSKSSHIGSCFSIVEILYVLYYKILSIDPNFPKKIERDKFILSKAHASAVLYAILAERGFFPKEYLEKYYIDNAILPGHLDRDSVPGIEISGGSLGHGLSIGLGMAIVNKNDNIQNNVYVLLGDGECNEGSIWEAVMLAASLKLDNLTAIIDLNSLQGFGYTKEIIDQKNLAKQWEAFGWEVYTVNGHNCLELENVLKIQQKGPKCIIAKTIKGKGVSFMENKLEWHYKSPNIEELNNGTHEIEMLK